MAAGGFADELDSPLGCVVDGSRINPALESEGSVGADVELAPGVAHSDGVPGRHLEDDGCCGFIDLGIMPADDPGEGLRAFGIGDDDVGFGELVLAGIERVDDFAISCRADDELAACEFGMVEHMAGVAQFERDVVGDIDDIVDRALPEGFDGFTKPLGRWADLDIADEPSGEERALVGDLVLQGELIADRWAHLHRLELGHDQLAWFGGILGSCDLAGDAEMPEAVASIGGHFDVDDGVAINAVLEPLDGHASLGEDVVKLLDTDIGGGEVLVDPAQ